MENLAYYFEDHNLPSERPCLHRMLEITGKWMDQYYASREDVIQKNPANDRPILTMKEQDNVLIIKDTRDCAVASEIILDGLSKEIYIACDAAKSKSRLLDALNQNRQEKLHWADIQQTINGLLEKKIMLKLKDRYLSLAYHESAPQLPTFDEYPGGFVYLQRNKPKAAVDPFQMSIKEAFGL